MNYEIRLSILLALWEVYDPYGGNEPVSFSDLLDSVPVDDSANFTYHLDMLTERFVEKTDDGYTLRNAGTLIVRAIIAGAGIEDSTVSLIEREFTCHCCGEGRVEISSEEAGFRRCRNTARGIRNEKIRLSHQYKNQTTDRTHVPDIRFSFWSGILGPPLHKQLVTEDNPVVA